MITIEGDLEYVYYRGSTFTVEWYKESDGSMPAKDYYEGLAEDDQERLLHGVSYLADSALGTRLPKTLYNLEDAENKIYAFKAAGHRFFNFMTIGRKIIIVNAYRKHSQKMEKKDLRLLTFSVRAKESYLRRVAEGVYYERHA